MIGNKDLEDAGLSPEEMRFYWDNLAMIDVMAKVQAAIDAGTIKTAMV